MTIFSEFEPAYHAANKAEILSLVKGPINQETHITPHGTALETSMDASQLALCRVYMMPEQLSDELQADYEARIKAEVVAAMNALIDGTKHDAFVYRTNTEHQLCNKLMEWPDVAA